MNENNREPYNRTADQLHSNNCATERTDIRTDKKQSTSVLARLLVSQNGVQDRRTPKNVFDLLHKEFAFDLDPCTSESEPGNLGIPYFTKEMDGLKQSWQEYSSIFINPPFRDMKKWVEKIHDELKKADRMTVVLLAPSKTETRWWHQLLESEFLEEVRFQKGRMIFEGHENPFIIGISFFVLKKDYDEFRFRRIHRKKHHPKFFHHPDRGLWCSVCDENYKWEEWK